MVPKQKRSINLVFCFEVDLAEGLLIVSPVVTHERDVLGLNSPQWSHSHVWWVTGAFILVTSILLHIMSLACSKRASHNVQASIKFLLAAH